MTGRLPNFLVIGAAKSGTTALYEALSQHPDVFMPEIKEPQFFAFEGQRPRFRGPGVSVNDAIVDPDQYRRLFADAGDAAAVGEASALYLYVPGTAQRIGRAIPDVRLVAILRQPADRAYSSYLHLKREGREPAASFEAALELEAQRIADGWGFLWRYRDMGYYARQLRPYRELFAPEQILVHTYDDFVADPALVVAETFRFLGVDPAYPVDLSARPNRGGIPRPGWRGRLLSRRSPVRHAVARLLPSRLRSRARQLVDARALGREWMSAGTRDRLTREFAADIRELSSMLGRDLDGWLATPGGQATAGGQPPQ